MASKLSMFLFVVAPIFLAAIAEAAGVLNRTPLAATSFSNDDGLHIRVYYQSTSGQVKETDWDEDAGWSTPGVDVVGQAKLNTGLAAVSWANGTELRQYYFVEDGTLMETATTNGQRTTGPVKSSTGATFPTPALYSKLAAGTYVTTSGTFVIKVFYQDSSNQIRIVHWEADEGWVEGSTQMPVAMAATGLAYDVLNDAKGNLAQERLFYQGTGSLERLVTQTTTAAWAPGNYNSGSQERYAPGASISCTSWGNLNAGAQFRIISVNQDNTLTLGPGASTTGWGAIMTLDQNTITGSDTATVSLAVAGQVRVYYQNTGGVISEFATNDGTNWVQGDNALPTTTS